MAWILDWETLVHLRIHLPWDLETPRRVEMVVLVDMAHQTLDLNGVVEEVPEMEEVAHHGAHRITTEAEEDLEETMG